MILLFVQINSIMWAELLLVPALRLLDLHGNFKKHILAPRARNQEIANLSFQGTHYNMGERYTDLTKVMFVCFFYSALFPALFLFGFAILIVQFYVSRRQGSFLSLQWNYCFSSSVFFCLADRQVLLDENLGMDPQHRIGTCSIQPAVPLLWSITCCKYTLH